MPYLKDDVWYLSARGGDGKWKRFRSDAKMKTEAKRLEQELRMKLERQRLGLEPLALENGGGTLGDLVKWWLETHSPSQANHERNGPYLRKHLAGTDIERQRLDMIRPHMVDDWLRSKDAVLSPKSVNHLRRYLVNIFNRAKEAEKFTGENPASRVRSRKVPKRLPDYLRAHEVMPVLGQLSAHHRPLFATAVYTGMRKGELFALRKSDVDLERRMVSVCGSHGRDTTKGGHADAIPVATELVPYLKQAIEESASELVFPGANGKRQREDTNLRAVLRRALGRAGIVRGYDHRCRRKGCGFSETLQNQEQRRCPKCAFSLWPVALVRPIRFHDLRHTTASLLMMGGASIAAVQRILRHSDPRITTEIYSHLAPDFLRTEIDKLSFGPMVVEEVPEPAKVAANAPLATISLLSGQKPTQSGLGRVGKTSTVSGVGRIGARGFEPPASWSRSAQDALAPGSNESQIPANIGVSENALSNDSPNFTPFRKKLATPSLLKPKDGERALIARVVEDSCLTVAEAGALLKVSTATVYKLVASGAIGHFRVSNSIRVTRAALDRFARAMARD